MATPFESKDGLGWVDQWGSDKDPLPEDVSKEKQEPTQKQKFAGKVKTVASTGVDKAKGVASTSAKKLKSGTSSGIQWIKDQYQKRTKK
ncbi:hypothetical protein KP509_32G048500 [Ceratopteris richardii]|uniref:Uncharacterized protein n=1 Tax=Ceratopteris richardii TaxID=49495 RepID=A0A8T2QV66_CERRI|nr:hypothetical protein KP509_32G048500 [Ceratopteris richardii]